jgi:hypothetical protein
MTLDHNNESSQTDVRFQEQDARIKQKIPDYLRGDMAKLLRKAKSSKIDRNRIRLCAWLLLVAQNRPESTFPKVKKVPMPSYLLAGALYEIDHGDEHCEEVARVYAPGRKACQHVQATAKAISIQFEKVLKKNLEALPVSVREDAQHVRTVLERFVADAEPGEHLLKRTRAKDEHEAFSPPSLTLIWWRYYLHHPTDQHWKEMFALAKVWGVSSAANLASFMRLVRELTEGKDHIPTPPLVSGASCPLSRHRAPSPPR